MKRLSPFALFFVLLSAALTWAAAPSPQALDQLVQDYFAKRPSQALTKGFSLEEALQAQQQFVAKLTPKLGKPIGYKVGVVTKEAQQRLGLSAPARGVLLSKMMLMDGAVVPVHFGTNPICEADLIVVVKDQGINQARTTLEVAQHLREVVAFIELPDSILATNQPLDGALLTAANVGARLGVLGDRIQVQPTPEFVTAMAEMVVTMTDQSGKELGKAQGKAILNNPLNAVLWLVEDLRRTGEKLKAGDLLSLGSLKAVPPPAGQTVTVRYEGLPGGVAKVSVRFRAD
jgi:2-keto-4-pentenoate hydratase